jgi:hypothetical protein
MFDPFAQPMGFRVLNVNDPQRPNPGGRPLRCFGHHSGTEIGRFDQAGHVGTRRRLGFALRF